MFVLRETVDKGGVYHECRRPECSKKDSLRGNSDSPGFFSETGMKHCPRCGLTLIQRVIPSPCEIRLMRTSDGLVVDRFPKTAKGRLEAAKTLKRYQRRGVER
uniref:Uncharacterized protein n=1 Tax=viral metagenome TaxID=1070528 RepID=A0A6M3KWC9_9ZZZZ